MLVEALNYAGRGWHVIPLKAKTKNQPLTEQGFKDATTDAAKVAEWWGRNPKANIAVALEASGMLLVDFDPRNRDLPWKHKWAAQDYDDLLKRCEDTGTLSATTGSGGRHFLFLAPDPLPDLRSILASGIDFKHNGYFVAAPSIHPDGGAYRWDPWEEQSLGEELSGELPVKPLPDWLIEMAAAPERDVTARGEADPDDLRPGTQFNAMASWAEAGLEYAGWTFVKSQGEEEFWCRPGKEGSISATANYEGSGLFYVFTTSTELESDRGYDKFGLYTRLVHGGDVDKAVEAVQDLWLPQHHSLDLTDDDLAALFRDTAPAVEDEQVEWDSAFPDNHFVTRYIAFASRQTSASPAYHEAAALSLLSIATHQVRAFLSPYPAGLKTNLYLLLVGASSRTYKSTSQDIMLAVLKNYREQAQLPSKSSTESMIDQLAGSNGLSKVWTPDEFGMALSEIGRREHLKGVEDLLLELYGNKRYDYQTLSRGLVTISNSHLGVFGASAPETLALVGATAMLGGLLPRFGMVFPRSLPPYRKAAVVDREALEKEARKLATRMRLTQEVATEEPEVAFTPAAMACLNAAEERLMTEGLHGARLPTMLYKVAILAAFGEKTPTNEVNLEHAESAVKVIERWRDSARHLQPYLRRKASDLEFERSMAAALDVLDELGGSATQTQMARSLRWPSSRFEQVQKALIQQGFIRVNDQMQWTKRGGKSAP